MANLPEANEYPAGIYQIETTDPVLGGPPNEATKAGLANIPAMQLAKRTNWLKSRVDTLLGKAIAATTLVAGLVRLSNAVNSTSETEAATPRAVKSANDNAESRALKTTSITTSGLAIGGGSLGQDREVGVPAATQEEAVTGTINTKAMTPLRVAQAIASKYSDRSVATSGYQVLPSGLILQWGQVSVSGAAAFGTENAVFPLTFPSACLQVYAHDPNSVLDATQYLVSAHDWTNSLSKISYKRVGGASSIVVINFFALGR